MDTPKKTLEERVDAMADRALELLNPGAYESVPAEDNRRYTRDRLCDDFRKREIERVRTIVEHEFDKSDTEARTGGSGPWMLHGDDQK